MGRNPSVLKLAAERVNLGLCNSSDSFACPLPIAQKNNNLNFKEESCLLIALLIAWYSVSFHIIYGHVRSEFPD